MAINSEGVFKREHLQAINEKLDSISNRLTDLEVQAGDNWLAARQNLTGMHTQPMKTRTYMEHVTHITNFYMYLGDCDHEPGR